MTTGLEEMLANITKLQVNNRKYARKAVQEGAELFAKNLEINTPEDEGDLESDVHTSNFKGGPQGNIEKDVGYGKGTGWRAKYPDNGTINQRPQNFQEHTINESRRPIQEIFAENIKEGLKL